MKFFSLDSIITGLLVVLYFFVPLIFTHLSDLFGIYLPMYPLYSYESIKVIFFLIVVFFLLILTFLHQCSRIRLNIFFIAFLVSIVFSVLLSDYARDAIIGSPERLHGAFFFFGMVIFGFILTCIINPQRRNVIIAAILSTLPFLFCYSIVQFFGFDPLFAQYSLTPFTHPLFATFGNSAYLAGYLLFILPLVFHSKYSLYIKVPLLAMIIIMILGTQSFTALILGLGYGVYQWYSTLKYKWRYSYAIVVLILIFSFSLGWCMFEGKVGSLGARWDMWVSALSLFRSDLIHFMLGYGPDTLAVFLSDHPVELLAPYIVEGGNLHSFHNIFLDMLFEFGVVGCIAFLGIIIHRLQMAVARWQIEIVILFLLFFSLNIASVSHWIIFIFALTTLPPSRYKIPDNVR